MSPIRFGACLLDLEARQLVRDGHPVHLSPKGFELLRVLVTASPKPVTKAELHERIWPGVFVTDDSLTKIVGEVRAAIGDRARKPVFVRTVHTVGYAFAAETVATRENTPLLIVNGRQVELPPGETRIGRDPSAQVVLDRASVSRQHAHVHVNGASAILVDQSTNGTSVNGERLTGPHRLEDGDEIEIAGVKLTFRRAAAAVETEKD